MFSRNPKDRLVQSSHFTDEETEAQTLSKFTQY